MKDNSPLKKILQTSARHPFTKVIAVLFAILLWSYVISITDVKRSITLNNVEVSLSNESQLEEAGLILLENPLAKLGNVSVELSVASKDISKINRDNVPVTVDLSGITEPGTYTRRLSARSLYAATTETISPATVEVVVENKRTRVVSTEATVKGRLAEDHWHSAANVTPDSVQVSGPESIVEKIQTARADMDISGLTGTQRQALNFSLYDKDGRVVPKTQLTVNTLALTVSLKILPKREYPLEDIALTTGEPAEGYRVKAITVQPESLALAAREENLENLPENAADLALFEPVDISGLTETKSFAKKLQIPDNMEYSSTTDVFIKVEIEEDLHTVQLALPIEGYGLREGYTARFEPASALLNVTGRQQVVENINPSRFQIYAELTNLAPGTHTVSLKARADEYSVVKTSLELESVEVTIEEIPAGAEQ